MTGERESQTVVVRVERKCEEIISNRFTISSQSFGRCRFETKQVLIRRTADAESKTVEAHLSVSILVNGKISRIMMQRQVHHENAVIADAIEMAFDAESTVSKSRISFFPSLKTGRG